MKHHMCRILTGLIFTATYPLSSAFGQTFSHTIPATVQAGKTTRVTCFGKGLGDARTLWTSFSAEVKPAADVPPTDTKAVFDVTIPAEAPVEIGGWRVVTGAGISDLRLCVIESLPTVTESGDNVSLEKAQTLTLPTAVDGIIQGEQRDFYSIEVAKGQSVSFETVADRLGTGLDPLLQIWNAQGKLVASYDNDEGLGFDARFSHTFEEAGKYIIEIRDTRYQGGGNWVYHLRMGDFPIARVAFPPGGQRGKDVSFAFPGKTATDVPPVEVTLDQDPAVNIQTLQVPGKNAPTWVPVAVDDRPQQTELEPNNEPAHGNAFIIGRTINGRFESAGDVDCFRFEAKKGQQVYFQGDTRRLASPADLYFTIQNAQGIQVAQADDQGTQEGELTFQVPADGTYVLTVEDLHRRGGPGFVYRVETSLGKTDYSLALGVDRLVIPKDSAIPVAVTATRAGVSAAIGLKKHDSSPLKVEEAQISSGAGAIAVAAPIDCPNGLYTLKILGSAQGPNGVTLQRGADFFALASPTLANLDRLPIQTVQSVPVLVTDRAFFSLAAKLGAEYVGRYVSTPIQIDANKDKFFDEDITLAVSNLPANVELAAAPIPKGQRSVTLQVVSKPKSPVGTFPVFVSGTAAFKGRSVTVFADIVYLNIQPALSLSVEPTTLSIARGAKGKLNVQVARHPGFTGPVDITFKNLPKGVTASAGKIADQQSAVEIELTVAADAPVAETKGVQAAGAATVGGQAESVQSPAFTLAVVEK